MTKLAPCRVRKVGQLLGYPLVTLLPCIPIVASFQEVSGHNMMGVVNCLFVFFFARPKRQNKLEEPIHSTQPESKVTMLKDLCWTR